MYTIERPSEQYILDTSSARSQSKNITDEPVSEANPDSFVVIEIFRKSTECKPTVAHAVLITCPSSSKNDKSVPAKCSSNHTPLVSSSHTPLIGSNHLGNLTLLCCGLQSREVSPGSSRRMLKGGPHRQRGPVPTCAEPSTLEGQDGVLGLIKDVEERPILRSDVKGKPLPNRTMPIESVLLVKTVLDEPRRSLQVHSVGPSELVDRASHDVKSVRQHLWGHVGLFDRRLLHLLLQARWEWGARHDANPNQTISANDS